MECKSAWFAPFVLLNGALLKVDQGFFLALLVYKRCFLWILLYLHCQLCFGLVLKVIFLMLVFFGWLSCQFFVDVIRLVEVSLLNYFDLVWGISWFPIHSCELDFSQQSVFSVSEGDMFWLFLTKCVHSIDHYIRHWDIILSVPCDLLPCPQTHKAISASLVTSSY